jgi:hypothetical protein
MGIYTKLGASYQVNPLDKALARLHYCIEAIRQLQNDHLFTAKKMSIWLNGPSEALHGKKIHEEEITNFGDTSEKLKERVKAKFYEEGLVASIILFEGEWSINDTILSGFFSCNNYAFWNRVYLDIEIDAYSCGDYGDLMDVFLAHKGVSEFAKYFVSNMHTAAQKHGVTPRFIYFSRGVPEYGEVEDLIALYLRDRRDMTTFLYTKLRKSKESWVTNQIAPMDKTFYLKTLSNIEALEQCFNEVVAKTNMLEKVGNSVTYIAEDTDSFSKFFKVFKDTIFRPSAKQLPHAEYLRAKMEDGLEGKRTATF